MRGGGNPGSRVAAAEGKVAASRGKNRRSRGVEGKDGSERNRRSREPARSMGRRGGVEGKDGRGGAAGAADPADKPGRRGSVGGKEARGRNRRNRQTRPTVWVKRRGSGQKWARGKQPKLPARPKPESQRWRCARSRRHRKATKAGPGATETTKVAGPVDRQVKRVAPEGAAGPAEAADASNFRE